MELKCDQQTLATVLNLSEGRISQLVKEGVIQRGDTIGEQIAAYCENLREVAGGRAPAEGGLDPGQEKAKLDREKRMGQRIKNLRDLGEWAAIGLLTKTLANASAALVSKLEALPGELFKKVPELPFEAVEALREAIAQARNDWVHDTAELDLVEDPTAEDDDDEDDEAAD
jgi:phage terminase Nu1 subunit (DNA packaging protein)